ncbi:hypothetical protein ScalyP_jg1085 [Parmales sp. scaly parma]|nr:hypothetical protein ScalyP_jg1085 [Parmales sp. scaly parma]
MSSPLSTYTDLKDEADQRFSKCMLNQVGFCIAGVAGGVALGYTRKSLYPLVAGGVTGTAADFAFGYFVNCTKEKERVNKLQAIKDQQQS